MTCSSGLGQSGCLPVAVLPQRGGPWVVGRADMRYRDLIPGRLDGRVVGSHIRIDGGAVPDVVHFHRVDFQLIYCHRGAVRVVYEDQGPPFVLAPGDCVVQPPTIRHRVLEAEPATEVIEVVSPAAHPTLFDDATALPTDAVRPRREFGGQRFHRHQRRDAKWGRGRLRGLTTCDTGIGAATGGVGNAWVSRRDAAVGALATPVRHDAQVLFAFVLAGRLTVQGRGGPPESLRAGDAFVVPPGLPTAYSAFSDDLELLEVSLPGEFATSPAADAGAAP